MSKLKAFTDDKCSLLLFVSLVTILTNLGTVQSTGSCADPSLCSNVTELVFDIYNGSVGHCLFNFTAVLTVTNENEYCRAFWNGLQCAAQGLASGGDIQTCLDRIKAIVDANPPMVLNQITQLTGLQLPQHVEGFANMSDTCNTTLSFHTPDASLCSNVSFVVFEIYNGSVCGCLNNLTAVLFAMSKTAYCGAFWDGLKCAAQGLMPDGYEQACLDEMKQVVNSNPPILLDTIVGLTGLDLPDHVEGFANATDTCDSSYSTFTSGMTSSSPVTTSGPSYPDLSLCSNVSALVSEIANGSLSSCLMNLTQVLGVTAMEEYCQTFWDGMKCAAKDITTGTYVQDCLDDMKSIIDVNSSVILDYVIEQTGLTLLPHISVFADQTDTCNSSYSTYIFGMTSSSPVTTSGPSYPDLSLCSNVSALVSEIANGSLSSCLMNLTQVLGVTAMEEYCQTFWDGMKCAAKDITTGTYVQDCLDDMKSIIDVNSSVILDYVIEQTGLTLPPHISVFADQTDTCNSSYSTHISGTTSFVTGSTAAPIILEPFMCGNVTILGNEIGTGTATSCATDFIGLLLERNINRLCVKFWNGLKCVARKFVAGGILDASYERACLNEMKRSVDEDSKQILTQVAAQYGLDLAIFETLDNFAGEANECALTTTDNAIVCSNDDACTAFSASLHCDLQRNTCMKDEVETCTHNEDCQYSLLHCLEDVSNSSRRICTPVVETCTSHCSGNPLTTCIANHFIKGVLSSICIPPVICTSDMDCTFINNLVCSEQVCTCMYGYSFIGGECLQETTPDGVLRCSSNHTCSQVFSELYCDVSLNLCKKKVDDFCATTEDCSHSLLGCVSDLCYPVMTNCVADSDCVSSLFTYCKNDHGLMSASNGICVPRNCSTAVDCSMIGDSEVDCVDSICDCRDGYDEISGRCEKGYDNLQGKCLTVLGKNCTSNSECPLDFAECSSLTCQCRPNFEEQGDICQGNFLTSVSISEASLIYVNYEPVTQFKCSFDAMIPNYFYRVTWLLGGSTALKSIEVDHTTNPDDIVLRSTDLSQTFLLNDMLSCSVVVRDSYGLEADFHTSAGFRLLQIDSPSISLTRGSMVEFSVTLNFPYGCSIGESCTFDILLFDITDDYACSGTSVAMFGNNTCGCKTTPKSLSDVENAGGKLVYSSEVFKCYITTKNDFYTSFPSPVNLMLKTAFYGRSGSFPFFEGNLNQQVTVNITQSYSGIPVCVAFATSRLQTFDKRQVDLRSSGAGTLTLYKNVQRGALEEIQIKTETSEWSSDPSIRGFFARAGKDVFGLYHTADNHSTGFWSKQSDLSLIRVSHIKNKYYSIRMPFGTEVFVHVDPEYSYFLNVVIIAAPGDYGNARGLCGNFNGDPADDLQDSSGSTVTTDADFVSAWRPIASDLLEDTTTHASLSEWPFSDQKCVCHTSYSHTDQTCAAQEDLSCSGGAIVRYGSLLTRSLGRKKREVTFENAAASVDGSYKQPAAHVGKRSAQGSKKRGHHIGKRDASTYCAALPTDCPFISIVDISGIINSQNLISYCESDYNANSTVDWLRLYCIPVQLITVIHLYRDTTFQVTNQALNNIICTGGCLNGGICTNGACQCPTGLAGSQCSLLKSLKPKILSDGVVVESISVSFTCLNVTTTGSSDGATCRIQVKSATYGSGTIIGFTETLSVVDVDAIIIDFNTVKCCMPSRRRRRRSTMDGNRQILISTSNDGITYSDPVVVTRIDATCQNITTASNGSTYIQLVSGYCFIDGACIVEGEANPSSSCQYCTTSYSYFNWNDTCIYSKKEEGLPVYAIVLIAVAAVAVVVVIIGVVYICYLRNMARSSVRDVIRNHLVREPSTGKFVLRQDSEVSEVWK